MNSRVLMIALVLVAGCGGTAQPRATSTPSATSSARTLVAGQYQPLWPFSEEREASDWQNKDRLQGHQPWHSDAAFTALAFTQGYLGFQQIDRVVSTVVDGAHARVAVGYRHPESTTAAVIHLVRYGSGEDAPWEVVGTDDTTLTVTTPRYGAAVHPPVAVGGQITGVDESIRIRVLQPWSDRPLAQTAGLPAGGERQPWSTKISFEGHQDQSATIVAWTGGHVTEVERFAVTGVTPR